MRENKRQNTENERIMESSEYSKFQKVYSKPTITEIGAIKKRTLSGEGVDFDSGEQGNVGAAS